VGIGPSIVPSSRPLAAVRSSPTETVGQTDTVKAIVQDRYGPPEAMELREIDAPAIEDDAVLVRVHAASVNPADWHVMRGDPYIARLSFGLGKPKDSVLGCDLAGEVEAVGNSVIAFRPGDQVFGSSFMRGFGGFAERASVGGDLLALKPANLTFEQAAAVPVAAVTALQALRDHGKVESGHKALIIGASGGVGTFAVQLAKHFGAEVAGVCSTRNVDLVRSLGADHVIDYTQKDFTQGEERYDLILQLAGTRSPSDCRRSLTPEGTLVLSSGESSGRWLGPIGRVIKASLLAPFVSQRLLSFTVNPNGEDLRLVKELIEAGEVTPVIDRTYSLSEVPEAIGYLEEGHARGKVVITVRPDDGKPQITS
jgi:NADPH:quinone reductase-like Zn-dependent oxidoreductase